MHGQRLQHHVCGFSKADLHAHGVQSAEPNDMLKLRFSALSVWRTLIPNMCVVLCLVSITIEQLHRFHSEMWMG
jgi:hypothetical protein